MVWKRMLEGSIGAGVTFEMGAVSLGPLLSAGPGAFGLEGSRLGFSVSLGFWKSMQTGATMRV